MNTKEESMNQEHAAIVYNNKKKIKSNVLTAKMDWKQLEAMAEMEANGRPSESESVVR